MGTTFAERGRGILAALRAAGLRAERRDPRAAWTADCRIDIICDDRCMTLYVQRAGSWLVRPEVDRDVAARVRAVLAAYDEEE